MATTKRPCRICRRWFEPDARVRGRQKSCSAPDCQRERHRRNCEELRDRDREAERQELLEQRLVTTEGLADGERVLPVGPRDAWPLKAALQIGQLLKVLTAAPRDACRKKSPREPRRRSGLPPPVARDATAAEGPGP